jgi:hypothetical protein
MSGPGGISWTSGRDDRELLARRRQEAEVRLARERARSARRALVGFVVLAGLLGVGIHYGIANFGSAVGDERLSPAQAAAKQFARSRIADVRFSALDGSICREIQFKNDTGQFLNNRLTRCDGTDENVVVPPAGGPLDPTERALAIREGFQKR